MNQSGFHGMLCQGFEHSSPKWRFQTEVLLLLGEMMHRQFWRLHPWKLTWHWTIPIFNRKYIFKRWIFQPVLLVFGGDDISQRGLAAQPPFCSRNFVDKRSALIYFYHLLMASQPTLTKPPPEIMGLSTIKLSLKYGRAMKPVHFWDTRLGVG